MSRGAVRVEEACEVLHDAYQAEAGNAMDDAYETGAAEPEWGAVAPWKPWADVPEWQKVAMRHAVTELLGYLDIDVLAP